ncbi:MAG: MoxR family ATPase [Proteobacteria bacterium]|nr:MoxR family ATPase [Pseudomonadota bacterium]
MDIIKNLIYRGSSNYVASQELIDAVNIAIQLEKPLIIRGEPGTGKTMLAKSIAESLELPFFVWHIKSTTKAKDGLYFYDTVQRLNDARFHDKDISDIKQYIKYGKLAEAFLADKKAVLLIDEIDKADIEFPNDLLNELDEMSFYIPETKETIIAKNRPIVIITSNSEKDLPDAFLRRCVFHYIAFPDYDLMKKIVNVHFPNIHKELLEKALNIFYEIRNLKDLRKKPSTSELIDWIKILILSAYDIDKITLKNIPFVGALIKKEQDLEQFNKLIRFR